MHTRAQLAASLQELVDGHYYREDFELAASVRAWHDALPAADAALLRDIVLERLRLQPTLVELHLVPAIGLAEAAPLLAAWLNQEGEASPVTRALLAALPAGAGDAAYRAAERFVDSDQEWEALRALARIDFGRARTRLLAAGRRDSQLDLALHILSDRRTQVGWPAFVRETRPWFQSRPAEDLARLRRVLQAKTEAYNPFTGPEREEMLHWLEEVAGT